MKRFTRISMALLMCVILTALAGCSKISRIKNSISGDKFTEIAENYGLEVEKLTEMIGAENINMISGDLKMKKAVDFMYENAVIK